MDVMHHGQREADLGRDRLQERQMRLERENFMSRSVKAAPSRRRRNEPLFVELPEQDYVRDSAVEILLRERARPSPASLEILMNVSMYI
jgi:hypothetical protein